MSRIRLIAQLTFVLRDFIRFNAFSRLCVSCLMYVGEFLRPASTSNMAARSANRLANAARLCPSDTLQKKIEIRLRDRVARIDSDRLDWDRLFPFSQPNEVKKGIVLKKPVSDKEKGVLLVAFQDHWLRLLRFADLHRLSRDFDLILAPTWSPPHDLPFMLATKLWPGKLYHIMSDFSEEPIFRRLADNLVTIPLISSNWVNPYLFNGETPVTKEFDLVMLANFARYKRHWLLFSILRDLPQTTRVLLLGRPLQGRTAQTLLKEAAIYGTQNRITIRENVSDDDLIEAMRSAKVSLILSGNEGACLAVVEAMFADIPVAVFADAIIGSKIYINEHTGVFLNRRHLAGQLQRFIEKYSRYRPRQWATENEISCFDSTVKLNVLLREEARRQALPWTVDIVPHQWRPHPCYVSAEHAIDMKEIYSRSRERYGISLVHPGVGEAVSV